MARAPETAREVARRHLRFGWWGLLFFLSFGMVLYLLGFLDLAWYTGAAQATRRHLWTLAHAHGTLLSLLNLAFALSVPLLARWNPAHRRIASLCLRAAAVLVPGGFLLGGVAFYAGDPGLGIALLPPGAALLFAGVLLTARASSLNPPDEDRAP